MHLASVIRSVYLRSPPIGTPRAIRVTVTPLSFRSFESNSAVVAGNPIEKFPDAELFRTDAFQRGQRAVENVVDAPIPATCLQRDE